MVTNKTYAQHAAISLACWKLPMASEEIAGTAAYRAVAPVGGRRLGINVPTVEFQRGGMAQLPVASAAVVDRIPAKAVLGGAPRGRPV